MNSDMTERNAKHNFIDYCQAMPGYGCHFYKLKVIYVQMQSAFIPKGSRISSRIFSRASEMACLFNVDGCVTKILH